MAAPNPELIPLIYRHLKEYGFSTAADEIRKLSPQPQQEDAPTSTSLLDIYKNWIRNAKRRKKPATLQPSPPNQEPTTPKKAAQQKKTDKASKPGSRSGSPNKKATPARRKKGDKTVKVVESKNIDDDGEGSDSDSSLDVEKWKKLAQEMTDIDLDKVEALNALAAPEPKKPRARKPRAKPKSKTEAAINGQGQQGEKSDETPEKVLTKSSPTKRSRSKKAAPVADPVPSPVAALDSSNKHQNNETPVASVVSTSKRSPKKEKRKASDQASVEPKKKKKTEKSNDTANATDGDGLTDKSMNNNDDELMNPAKKSIGNAPDIQTEPKKKKKTAALNVLENAMGGDGLDGKNISDNGKDVQMVSQGQENPPSLQTEPKKKKKKKQTTQNILGSATGGEGLNSKNITDNGKDVQMVSPTQTELKEGSQENSSHEPKKKKKKKKLGETTESNELVENAGRTVEDLNGNVAVTSSLNTVNAEAESTIKVKKKKKKKDKDDTNSQHIVTEANTNAVVNEVTCETTVEEPSPNTEVPKKKKKKDKSMKESETLLQTEADVIDEPACDHTEQIVVKKKSKKKKKQSEEHLGTENKTATTEGSEKQEEPPDLPSTPQTPGSKKKKHKLDSGELAKADAGPPTLDTETPKKKKKKASKNKESES